jgi:hypothetical protein
MSETAVMRDHEMQFREIKYTLPPEGLRVLRSAAANIKNKGKADAVLICRLYLPALSETDADLFLQWLAKQPG